MRKEVENLSSKAVAFFVSGRKYFTEVETKRRNFIQRNK